MTKPYDVIIVGGGPGGLACARMAALDNLKVLLLERNHTIGKKVCAGGITWNGLIKKMPSDISERSFTHQFVFSPYQNARISSSTPIIATVNRQYLGEVMLHEAQEAGATCRLGLQVTGISGNSLTCINRSNKKRENFNFSYLVGADGSTSFVRRTLKIPRHALGIGINYHIPGEYSQMEWHLDHSLFANGYAWVFPHKNTVSTGAYVDSRSMKATELKKNFLYWAERHGLQIKDNSLAAELINFDYRGYQFGNKFLIGDAAGLASGLTGEGIYPAIISGESVAKCIVDRSYNPVELHQLIKNHRRHRTVVSLTGKSKLLNVFLAEMAVFGLKKRIIPFSVAEMAH